MKKIALIFLICIYSLATLGIGLKEFYCCGKLQEVTVTIVHETKNNKCEKANDKSGCCDNKYQFFKVKDKHITAENSSGSVKFYADTHTFTPIDLSIPASQKIAVVNRSNAPPLHPDVPDYIYNCVFRI